MSYLDGPRLVFSGQFQADPSTINNDPEHFNASTFRSNYDLQGQPVTLPNGQPGMSNGWWNPAGSGAWRFRGCTVRQVVYEDGTSCSDPSKDPLVGEPVNDTDVRVEGKLVDLDPEQQMVSQIWGFQVLLGSPLRGFGFRSDFRTAPFADIWVRVPTGQPDSFFGAFYQSVLNVADWAGVGGSRLLAELSRGGEAPPKQLSIRFNVDGYNDDTTSPEFTFGRVVGTIGPYDSTEPVHFLAGRALQSANQPYGPSLNTAYAQLVGDVLTLDLGNSIPNQSVGGPPVALGQLYAALLPASGPPVILGEIPYADASWYGTTAGIVSFKLDSRQAGQAADTPLGVVAQPGPGVYAPLLAEAADGVWLRADEFVFRLNPGDTRETTFYATSFGRRAAGQQISLAYDPSSMAGQITQGPVPGPAPVGQPESAFEFKTGLTTGVDGTAGLKLEAGDPGNPRTYIDGQLYGVTYGAGPTPPANGSVQNPSQLLNALVFSGYEAPGEPDWLRDVQPIFQQYANLYPVMRPIVDLADYASVVGKRAALLNVFGRKAEDPNYMPVTRDLSRPKQEMILKWLRQSPPLYMRLDSVEDLMAALQQAIELEHSTIPPYLCALYSIKPGANNEVAELVRSVVIEEMLHMALVSNLLVSVGGSPQIARPDFVPRYPGPLPGGLRGGLTVRLRRCSIAQVRDVFMSIEEPEETVEPVDRRGYPGGPGQANPYTIGWFYDELKRALTDLSGAGQVTFGHTDQQVSDWTGTGKLYVIGSLEDALAAIDEIKVQGEGAAPLDPDDEDRELAHYYKFSEIVHGRRIVVGPGGYSYTGEHIPFDPEGVYPMMDDPDASQYPDGSRALILSNQFAETYRTLLNGLHRTFNGEPGYLGEAVGVMYSLSVIARQLMQTPSGRGDGTTAGPSFQLPFPL
jgi:hypothetical protein